MVRAPRARRRRRVAGLLVGGLVLTSAVQLSLADASQATTLGNPRPNSDTKATTTLNADGTVTATLSGTWSSGQSCSLDYSTAWAVDWWGVSTSPYPANNVTVTNATAAPAPGAKTTGSIQAAGAQKIWMSGYYSYFHVGPYFAGENVHSSGTCTDVGLFQSTGGWSASATYPSASSLPAQLCVAMYDTNGFLGHPSWNPYDYDPSKNWNNSVAHHDFDLHSGYGSCVDTPTPPPPPPPPPPTSTKYGYVEICQDGANGVTGDFTFAFAGTKQTVPANLCGPAVRVPAGNLTIKQQARDGFAMSAATAGPGERLISSTPKKSQAVVYVPPGQVSSQTIVRFYDTLVGGQLKVCQVAGAGVNVGTNIAYTTSTGVTFTVAAGPAPGGYCQIVGTYLGQVRLSQDPAPASRISDVMVAPASRYVGFDGAARAVTVQIGKGVTELTVTNVNP